MGINEDIRSFLVLARHPSMSAAARELGVDRSSLSKALARLEDRVDTRLVHRSTRHLSLTAAGRLLADRAEAPLRALDSLIEDLTPSRLKGRVRVTAPLAFGLARVAPAIEAFMEDHADVCVEVSYDDAHRPLTQQGIDIAVRGGRLPESELVARRLFGLDVGVFAAPSLLEGPIAHPDDLAGYPFLLNRYQTLRFYRGETEVALRPRVRLVSRVSEARLRAARRGLGITLLPVFLDAEGLVRLLPDWTIGTGASFYLVRPPGEPSATARALWNHLCNWLVDPR